MSDVLNGLIFVTSVRQSDASLMTIMSVMVMMALITVIFQIPLVGFEVCERRDFLSGPCGPDDNDEFQLLISIVYHMVVMFVKFVLS